MKVRNKVYVIRNSQKSDAKPLMPVLLRDAVETGAESRAKLLFKDDSVLNLGEKSRVFIQEYLNRPGNQKSKSIYKFIDGYLKVIVGRSDLKVHSPTAVVAARGTEFILWVDESGPSTATGIIMLEGKAELRNINELVGGTLIIRRGQMSMVYKDRPPERPRPADLKIMNDLKERTGEVRTYGPDSKMEGKIINKSSIDGSKNIAVGEDSESNMGSVVIK